MRRSHSTPPWPASERAPDVRLTNCLGSTRHTAWGDPVRRFAPGQVSRSLWWIRCAGLAAHAGFPASELETPGRQLRTSSKVINQSGWSLARSPMSLARAPRPVPEARPLACLLAGAEYLASTRTRANHSFSRRKLVLDMYHGLASCACCRGRC